MDAVVVLRALPVLRPLVLQQPGLTVKLLERLLSGWIGEFAPGSPGLKDVQRKDSRVVFSTTPAGAWPSCVAGEMAFDVSFAADEAEHALMADECLERH